MEKKIIKNSLLLILWIITIIFTSAWVYENPETIEILKALRLLGWRIGGVLLINYCRGEIDVFERLHKWIEKTPQEIIEHQNW